MIQSVPCLIQCSPLSVYLRLVIYFNHANSFKFKGPPSGLSQFQATESPLEMMKTVLYTLRALFADKIFEFLFKYIGSGKKFDNNKGNQKLPHF